MPSFENIPSTKELAKFINTTGEDNMDLDKGGVKFDSGKVRMDLLPPEFLFAVAAVLTYGAEKYEPWNFAKGMRLGRVIASLDRHKTAFMAGEEFDADTGFPHTWMIAANIAMIISCQHRHTLQDDRNISDHAWDEVVGLWDAIPSEQDKSD